MTCEAFLMEMYAHRMASEVLSSSEFTEHLQNCASCAQMLGRMLEQDAAIRHTLRSVQPSPELAQSIFSGLAADRALSGPRRLAFRWRQWMLVPVGVTLAMMLALVHVMWRTHSVAHDAAILLQSLPPLELENGDRDQVLHWTAQVEPGTDALPRRLARLQFRGASAVKVDDHAAVLLRMKHETRASLLIVDGPLLGPHQITARSIETGSLAYWTEQRKIYVLLFQGNLQDLKGYMRTMGITA